MTELGLAADPFINLDTGGNYSFDTSAYSAANNTYTLTATARGNQASNDAPCTTFSVNELGQKSAESANCWEQ